MSFRFFGKTLKRSRRVDYSSFIHEAFTEMEAEATLKAKNIGAAKPLSEPKNPDRLAYIIHEFLKNKNNKYNCN